MNTTAKVLTTARDLYSAAPDHCEGFNYPKSGCYCPITAIQEAGRVLGWVDTWEYLTFFKDVNGINYENGLSVVDFNYSNTTETVVAAFDKAIEAAS